MAWRIQSVPNWFGLVVMLVVTIYLLHDKKCTKAQTTAFSMLSTLIINLF